MILTKLKNYLKSSMIHRSLKTRLRLSEPVSVEIEAYFTEPDEKILTTMSSIFLIAGVEEATNSSTLILAQDSFARLAIFGFKLETLGF